MKILFGILVFLTHQLSFATYTEVEKNIKYNISYVISLTYYHHENLQDRILNSKVEEYSGLIELARFSGKNSNYKFNDIDKNDTVRDINHLNCYLQKIDSSPDINVSKKFLNDIQLLVASYNNSIKKYFPDISTVKLPSLFTDKRKTKNKSSIRKIIPKQIPSSKYTTTENSIKMKIATLITSTLHHEQKFEDQILNAKIEEYPALMQSAQFFAQTLKWKIYNENEEYKEYKKESTNKIEEMSKYLDNIANSNEINLSNKFKKDILLLVDAYNQPIQTSDTLTIRLPKSFTSNDKTKKHSTFKEWINKFRSPASQKT
jgi:hypothetical protein